MNATMVETGIRTGIRMRADAAHRRAVASPTLRFGASTTTKKLGKTTR